MDISKVDNLNVDSVEVLTTPEQIPAQELPLSEAAYKAP